MLVNKIFFPCSQKMRQVYTRSEDTIIVEWFSTREHNVLWFKDRKQAIKDIVFALKKLHTHPERNFDSVRKHIIRLFQHGVVSPVKPSNRAGKAPAKPSNRAGKAPAKLENKTRSQQI